ncbi:hypothetical protein [Actinoplanes teichomyceticus]|uniref:Uncharacterized protein n=1 Tax=Actinoplanes teichomyceticus TaxID=1867 RepID=A0A561WAT3_ACTTI|nr:hypothetical protein [Actinoplanes teichomyceticus]TWG20976.1 hypothetical protein FHX34_103505 [Actinoplanes teichomyceticus]GIF14796.1 hypothetical protein Ate01nite_48280 [Actinoplanes teichomyceticus]
MPTPAELAVEHASVRRRMAVAVADEARRAWRQVDPARIAESWIAAMARLLLLVTGAQRAAAGRSEQYLTDVLTAQGLDPAPVAELVPEALSGVASDGRPLDSLLYQPVITALTGLQRGATLDRALAGGQAALDMIVRTQIADAGRVADQVAMTARPDATGYVRMLVGRSCSRCAILAGRWYAVNAGFRRHPRCDCVHIPGREDTTRDARTDPDLFFRSLSRAEQDRVFTKAGAEAIRLGADIGQVVNSRRGAIGLTPAGARITAQEARALRNGLERGRLQPVDVFGRQLVVTTEGTTVRGEAGRLLGARENGVRADGRRYRSARIPRLMPESILQIAGRDRDEAVRLLKRFGYLR